MLFKKDLLAKILNSSKTQTRRSSARTYKVGRVYGISCRRYQKPQAHIQILQARKQRLGEISEEDVRKEGFSNMEEFREAWQTIYGSWDPEQLVTAYEFTLIREDDKDA